MSKRFVISGLCVLSIGLVCGSCMIRSAGRPDVSKMAAQMLVVGFRGTAVRDDSPVMRNISRDGLGGVILFDYDVVTGTRGRNIQDKDQLLTLTSRLQSVASIPLFVCIDQEGGQVCRLSPRYGFAAQPSQQELGERNDPDLTLRKARETARLLSACGINVNFAPVADVNLNPANPVIGSLGRSFGSDPELVGRHCLSVVIGHREYGVLAVPKHFPGHGSSAADSHAGLVDVSALWQLQELEPYRYLISEAGIQAVMTAHIYNRTLDSQFPATLSERTIHGLLRQNLGFEGIVFSDDMNMKAITSQYGFERALELGVNAGVDVFVLGNNLDHDPDIAQKAISAIVAAVREGRIDEQRLYQSWARIMRVKDSLVMPDNS